MHKFYQLIFILLFISHFTLAQENDSAAVIPDYPFIVDSITLTGNEITDADIILRELTFGTGDTLTLELAEYNKERIFSLGIFTKVELHPFIFNGLNFVQILVEEGWYIYPIPFASLKDKDWDKISYGFSIVVKNFLGRNETIQTRAAFGYDPSFSLKYYKPSIVMGSKIFFQVDASYQSAFNRSRIAENIIGGSFEQTFISGQVLLGKRFGLFHWLSMNLNYNYVETPFYSSDIAIADDRIDRFPSAGINYTYDTRDLVQFPKDGIFFWSSFQYKGWGLKNIDYSIFNLDFREYRNVTGDLHAKWRFASRFAFGNEVPFYDYSFLGYAERIRGHFDNQSEGHNTFISSLEFYHPIIKDMNISFDWVPLLPKQLLRYRIALYAQLFADTGIAQLKGTPLSINKFNTGFGGGLIFLILPYNSIRVEFAVDEFQNSEFIFDLGISF